ncbi:MAG: pasT [Gammaproteobacteria bacterium]|jgi:ribosome-associated toxin RatA of RatAB toxin-antitoxin module|nr:pasT [Gammaproteobacteria bacterium]
MNVIKRTATVRYSPQQMFELVNNIKDYPRFLPWCSASTILYHDDKEVEAALEIEWSGIHKNFTTRNYLYPYERIKITLVHGPFRHLEGKWMFTAFEEHGCKVDLELEFDLGGRLVDKIFQPIFNHMANSLVDLFCKRAVEVYGSQEENQS